MRITDYTVEKLVVPERVVSDSQIHVLELDEFEYVYLKLETDTGTRGIGYSVVDMESPESRSVSALRKQMGEIATEFVGESPFRLINQQSRHRGGLITYYSSESYGTGLRRAIDYALWDLCGKHLDLPVYQLMGGEDPEVPVYGSGLGYSLSDDELRSLYETFKQSGITAAKVKVGYPTLERDLERLSIAREVMGSDATLMVDANEAWSPKQAIRRIRGYRDAGFDIYWVEDPTFRKDREGIRRVVEGIPFAHVNTGEYCGFEEKRAILEHGACDILNVHGFTPARRAATLAHSYGVPIATGTDHAGDVSAVHVGAAIDEVDYVEFTMQRFFDLAEDPYEFEDGKAIAPSQPGHGVEIEPSVIEEFKAEA